MWKKSMKISLMFCLFFLVFGLGIFLPDKLFAVADEKRGAAVELDDTTPLILPDAEQAAIEKKLNFLYQTANLSSLQFFSLSFDAEEMAQIQKIINRETKKLRKYKLIPKKAAPKKFFIEKFSILDTSESGEFLTMWFVWNSISQNGTLQFFIESESEKLLSVNYINEQKHNWKPAKKAFQKYLCRELSIDAKDIPEFIFYCDAYSYSITSECFLAYREIRGYPDTINTSIASAAKNAVTDVDSFD